MEDPALAVGPHPPPPDLRPPLHIRRHRRKDEDVVLKKVGRKRRPSFWRLASNEDVGDLLSSSTPFSHYHQAKRPRRYSTATSVQGGDRSRARSPVVGDAASNNASQEAALAERLAQRLPGLFVALDEEGRVVVWNQQCERLTGWTLAEVRADAGRLFPDAQYRNRIAAEWDKRSKLPLYHDWEWRVVCRDGSHRTFSWTSCQVFSSLSPWSKWAMGRDVTDEKKSRELLKEVALGFTATSADDFFQQLVQHLIVASGLDHAIVGEYQPGRHNSIRTIAACVDGQLVPNIGQSPSSEYYLEGTPCENVVKQSACTLHSCVRELFPNDHLLGELGVEGYVGRPLFSVAGKVIGLMVLMSRHVIHDAERAEMVMDIFAGRASAEFERRQHEVALKKSELLFRQVTDNIAPMVYVATPGLAEFHYASAPFATMWGHPPGQLLQQPQLWFDCIHPDDRVRMQECTWGSRESDTHSCEFRVVHATTGAEKWVRDRGWKIWPADGDPRVVGIVEDISLERQALEHLEKARQMAEEASTAKTLFLANISHEIRTPLQGILGMLELLDSSPLGAMQRDNLRIAKRSADHMLFLVNDLLDVVRIEKGKLEICPARFSLHDYLDYLSSSFARNAETRGLRYASRLAPGLPDVVVGDKDRLAQVLSNILNNALKFTPPGGHVTLTASLPTRGLVRERIVPPADSAATQQQQQQKRCSDGEDWVLFEVSDTGIGIPQDKLPHIFDAFYQVDPAHTKKYAGLGMGLKICYELVGMMNGHIWVDSAVGKGTTFHVLLPFAQPPREQEERERERAEPDGPGDLGTKSLDILLVEDNIVNQKVICRLLSQRGYQFQIANNGAEAVEKVKSGPQQFAAILMDVQMPVMDGLTATIRIREMEAEARAKSDTDAEERTPIIGLTAGAMLEDKEKCLAAGMDDYLSKPVSRECLLNALLRWTQATQRRRQQQTAGDEVEDSDDEAEPPPRGRPTSPGRAL